MIIRDASRHDLGAILEIYNQGIEDRIATLETDLQDMAYMENWYANKNDRYTVLVAELNNQVVGWASISPYNLRTAYNGVGEISIYIHRNFRGEGIGKLLLIELEKRAKQNQFHKLVLFTFSLNLLGQGLYRAMGYREVGIFINQGFLDGEFVDIMAMEKLLHENL
ncbi:arsinothricin resistance N-acetyltransferase ArsN1 family A [Aquibacillus salsiterrae]|uniref:Arsinothricin resistance N-acetyltransferase ArsN1 n=1 Tax=Aquibacillus salsiterrae TaxID=2950439 RepID=A0A9X4AEI9_9BACI|nr:arsinothricin resistance N-acetyltransferase ArsN1 family A [Aquibacillus salsiterrae]MDC3416962.1 arsinothricin resistance N-acetyltransferase ArsN1 [Aquibacillus salsiterrae]